MNLPKAPIINCVHEICDKALETQRDADHQFYQSEHDKLEKELEGRMANLEKLHLDVLTKLNDVELAIEEAKQQGRREVVEWVKLISFESEEPVGAKHYYPKQLESKLKDWGLK